MKILIEGLTFETIIGILDHERLEQQKVMIDCTIDYPYSQDRFINYADVCTHIRSCVQKNQFFLIEEALETLGRLLKEIYPQIEALEITLRKPDILPNCTVGVQSRFVF